MFVNEPVQNDVPVGIVNRRTEGLQAACEGSSTVMCVPIILPSLSPCQLAFCWRFKAATMCEFSKEEFITGLQTLGYGIPTNLVPPWMRGRFMVEDHGS